MAKHTVSSLTTLIEEHEAQISLLNTEVKRLHDVVEDLTNASYEIPAEQVSALLSKIADRIEENFLGKTKVTNEVAKAFVAPQPTKPATGKTQPVRGNVALNHPEAKCGVCYKPLSQCSGHAQCPLCHAPDGKAHSVKWENGVKVYCPNSNA